MHWRKAWLTAASFVCLATAEPALANVIVVDPNNPNGWIFSNTDNSGTNASGGFSSAQALSGNGSARLTAGSANSSEILIDGFSSSISAGSISSLEYSTYVTSSMPGSGAAPTLQFDIFEGSTYEGRLVFDPGLLGTVTNNTWQTWNAETADAWYFSHPALGNGGCALSGGSYCTLATVQAILGKDGALLSDILFKAGSGQPNFNGFVDDLDLNGTTTNFDVPEPGSLALLGGALALLGMIGYRRRIV